MLGVRLDAETEAALGKLARRTRRTKSDLVREAVRRYVWSNDQELLAEARRQSLAAAARAPTPDDEFWDGLAAADDEDPARAAE